MNHLVRALRRLFHHSASGTVEKVGSAAAAMEHRSPLQEAAVRLPWLMATMFIELCAGFVVAHFDSVLRQVILLASFMPVISAISGNVGLQAAAIIVRALDTGQVQPKDWLRSVRKELLATSLMALVCGAVLGTIGSLWAHHWTFGVVVAAAMTCSMLTAGIMGTAFPILSKSLGFDPAASAGPLETSAQDIVGFSVSLALASELLRWLR